MKTRWTAIVAAGALLVGGGVAMADIEDGDGPPQHVLDRAHGAAAEAHRVANGLQKPKNPNSAAGLTREQKAARRAGRFEDLAAKLADRGHGQASAVHQALAAGRSPSELAGLNAEAARAMADANAALRAAGEKPGKGNGRGNDGDDGDD